jgi:prophage DNA circulation protein
MTWRDELRPASFRGVPFEVVADSGSFGRRVQLHEYPQRDKPWAEDLGRATRTFEVTAFLVGDDYMVRRDALLAALEGPGPGTLIHPWYGELTVNVKELARVAHSRTNGGMCEIVLSFVEAGELTFPTATDSRGAQTLLAADAVNVAAAADFTERFAVDGQPSFVLDSVVADLKGYIAIGNGYLDNVQQVLADPLAALLDLAGLPGKPVTALEEALGLPTDLADAVLGLFNRGRSVLQTVSELFDRDDGDELTLAAMASPASINARNRNAVVALTAMSRAFGAVTVATYGAAGPAVPTVSRRPASVQTQVNRAALATLFQRSALIQAAGMSAAMALPVYDDAVLVRDSITAAIDEASFDAGDDVYIPLQVLRARVHADITARLSQAARLLDYTPREVLPALALVYELYEDVGRELELVERNALRHPGFVPARALKVLSA